RAAQLSLAGVARVNDDRLFLHVIVKAHAITGVGRGVGARRRYFDAHDTRIEAQKRHAHRSERARQRANGPTHDILHERLNATLANRFTVLDSATRRRFPKKKKSTPNALAERLPPAKSREICASFRQSRSTRKEKVQACYLHACR